MSSVTQIILPPPPSVASGSGVFFQPDIDAASTVASLFADVNTYSGVIVDLSTTVYRPGHSKSIRVQYPVDEAGVELKPPAFASTPTLFTRKYEYFASGWETNWPVGLKTSRYFTTADWTQGAAEPNAYAYMSEKAVWQSYSGDTNDNFARGFNHACFNYDLEGSYAGGSILANGGATGYTSPALTPNAYLQTGQWYKIETWMQINSAADATDGVLQFWIDDQLIIDINTFVWRSTSRGCPNGTGWQSMWFGGNYSGAVFGSPSATVSRHISDLYLSTTKDR